MEGHDDVRNMHMKVIDMQASVDPLKQECKDLKVMVRKLKHRLGVERFVFVESSAQTDLETAECEMQTDDKEMEDKGVQKNPFVVDKYEAEVQTDKVLEMVSPSLSEFGTDRELLPKRKYKQVKRKKGRGTIKVKLLNNVETLENDLISPMDI